MLFGKRKYLTWLDLNYVLSPLEIAIHHKKYHNAEVNIVKQDARIVLSHNCVYQKRELDYGRFLHYALYAAILGVSYLLTGLKM